jgi:segregation and condensation protein B
MVPVEAAQAVLPLPPEAADIDDARLQFLLEALLFVAGEPAPVSRLAAALNVSVERVEQGLLQIGESLLTRGIRLQRQRDVVQLVSAPEAADVIESFLGLDLSTRLSRAALEALAIIAYRQPVTRPQVDAVRGVNSDGVMKTLLNRGLIEEVGRLEQAGRPILYGTTFSFLQYFGLSTVEELPPLQADAVEHLSELATLAE